ncbi:hypothetical protein SAMN05421688_0099 [Poseidonocella pacifica]|uniref:Uncharacterized protein n=1 Tax=Poseidonocella pacifica TaxID=871651 RepID=A0A1I0UYU0_9RHOB|nr:hypothetical protein SAMN05421688_0099 [Poseidonocella pacifica]
MTLALIGEHREGSGKLWDASSWDEETRLKEVSASK